MFHQFKIIDYGLQIIAILFAVVLHETAHGYAALKMGDPSAKQAGRLTLNPLPHIDPFGSVILPVLLIFSGSPVVFGYAKPVPVDMALFFNQRLRMIIVAVAGVAVNFCLAVASGLAFRWFHALIPGMQDYALQAAFIVIARFLFYSTIFNVVLMVFNLFPIPPLDGSRVVAALLPTEARLAFFRAERVGMVVLVILLLTGSIDKVLVWIINPIFLFLTGLS